MIVLYSSLYSKYPYIYGQELQNKKQMLPPRLLAFNPRLVADTRLTCHHLPRPFVSAFVVDSSVYGLARPPTQWLILHIIKSIAPHYIFVPGLFLPGGRG